MKPFALDTDKATELRAAIVASGLADRVLAHCDALATRDEIEELDAGGKFLILDALLLAALVPPLAWTQVRLNEHSDLYLGPLLDGLNLGSFVDEVRDLRTLVEAGDSEAPVQ